MIVYAAGNNNSSTPGRYHYSMDCWTLPKKPKVFRAEEDAIKVLGWWACPYCLPLEIETPAD